MTAHHLICSGDCVQSLPWGQWPQNWVAGVQISLLCLGCASFYCIAGSHWKNASDSECAGAQRADSTLHKMILVEMTREGTGDKKAVAEAETLVSGSLVYCFNAQRLLGAGRTRALHMSDVATAVSLSGAWSV